MTDLFALLAATAADGWADALSDRRDTLDELSARLAVRAAAGERVLPDPDRVFAALATPAQHVRVLIVGQDPYPTPGHATGLAFSVPESARPLPPSLRNILREYSDDTGLPAPASGDLSAWSRQGVMLLNRALTVTAGDAGSHRADGWQAVTNRIVEVLAAREVPPVAILWGRDAQQLSGLLPPAATLRAPHPSPLAAWRGFFGSRPFSRANELLVAAGRVAVDWRLPT